MFSVHLFSTHEPAECSTARVNSPGTGHFVFFMRQFVFLLPFGAVILKDRRGEW